MRWNNFGTWVFAQTKVCFHLCLRFKQVFQKSRLSSSGEQWWTHKACLPKAIPCNKVNAHPAFQIAFLLTDPVVGSWLWPTSNWRRWRWTITGRPEVKMTSSRSILHRKWKMMAPSLTRKNSKSWRTRTSLKSVCLCLSAISTSTKSSQITGCPHLTWTRPSFLSPPKYAPLSLHLTLVE